MIVVLDTETTGLRPGSICQLSYVLDEGLGSPRAENYFFEVDFMPADAQAVHGFSLQRLKELSCGIRFADAASRILVDFKAADIVVGHNLDFDMRFLRAEFERCGLRYRHRRGLCTMNYFTRRLALPRQNGRGFRSPSLLRLCEHFAIAPGDIAAYAQTLFGEATAAHDARYDAAATYLCVVRAMEGRVLRDLFVVRNPPQAM